MKVGDVLDGQYRLDAILGIGGMGRVWKALDLYTGRIVAIKELLVHDGVEESRKAELCKRCFREAKNAARLDHIDVITIYGVLKSKDGRPWIVMQYQALSTLDSHIRQSGAMLPSALVVPARRLFETVAYVHSRGVLHRDIKPDNLMRRDDGTFVVLDFGIARSREDTATVGGFHCTAAYAAPEVLEGKESTEKSDAWSLGITLHYALTGMMYYGRETSSATMIAVVTEEPPVLAGDSPLEHVIKGLLVKDPDARLSVSEAAAILQEAEAIASADTTTAPAKSVPATHARRRVSEKSPSSRRIVMATAVVGAVILAAAVLVVVKSNKDSFDNAVAPSPSVSVGTPSVSPTASASAATESASPSASSSVVQTGGTFTNGKLSIRLADNWSVMSVDADNVISISTPDGSLYVKLHGVESVSDIAETLSKADNQKLEPALHYPAKDVAEWGYSYVSYCAVTQSNTRQDQGQVNQASYVNQVDYVKGFLCSYHSYSRVWRSGGRVVSARMTNLNLKEDVAKRVIDDLASRVSIAA